MATKKSGKKSSAKTGSKKSTNRGGTATARGRKNTKARRSVGKKRGGSTHGTGGLP